jgi:hypothetical protein
MQVIDPQQLLIQSGLEPAPRFIRAQQIQQPGQPIITEVQRPDGLADTSRQRLQAFLHPGLDVIQPMVGLRNDVAHPARRHPAGTQSLPVSVGGKVPVEQARHLHPLELGQ